MFVVSRSSWKDAACSTAEASVPPWLRARPWRALAIAMTCGFCSSSNRAYCCQDDMEAELSDDSLPSACDRCGRFSALSDCVLSSATEENRWKRECRRLVPPEHAWSPGSCIPSADCFRFRLERESGETRSEWLAWCNIAPRL